MNTNNIDSFFKSNIRQTADIWNKEDAWGRFQQKRKIRFRKTIITVSLVIVVLLSLPYLLIERDNSKPQNNLTEAQKRQKLFEIEKKLYELHKKDMICENCNEFINNNKGDKTSIFIN